MCRTRIAHDDRVDGGAAQTTQDYVRPARGILSNALNLNLVSGNVAVIVSSGGDATSGFAKAATSTIPIVAAIGGLDPVKSDLVDSLNRSGRNITAVSFFSSTLLGKRFELLCELVPSGTIGVLLNPNNTITPSNAGELKSAALSLNRQTVEVMAAEDADLTANGLDDRRTGRAQSRQPSRGRARGTRARSSY
jgi:ABC-type uncharacterized transport system substrate-binding protein